MQQRVLLTTDFGDKFWATREQADTIEVLAATRKGGMAKVAGYRPSTGYVTSPVQDVTVLTRFSVEKLYERKRKALEAITLADMADAILAEPKLSALPTSEVERIFNERKASEIASLEKTLEGDRSDAHRQGHDRCYSRVADGVKVHYLTEKDTDGLKQPVLLDGFPICESIMLPILEISKTVRVPGEYKKVNSGAPVLMGNAISKLLNKRSVGFKTLSLKEGNFERLTIDRETILPEDVAGLV